MTERSSTPPRTLERHLSKLLTWSTALAALIVLLGLILLFATRHQDTTNFSTFSGEPPELKSPARIMTGVLAPSPDRPLHILQAGILLLILTPTLRVLFTLVTFAARRDVLYVVITLIVLGALIYGLAGGEA